MLNRTSVLAILAVMTAAWAGEAAAQAAPSDGRELEGLVVTARRRVETLQEVPSSVAVVETETIERLNMTAPRDLIYQVPGVRMAASTVGAAVADDIVIRGVGTARLETSGAPTGIFRNNMFIGNGTFFGRTFTPFDLFDIQRFEIFKGPQGALWGRQAAGGAISIVSNQPAPTFSARAKAGYEFKQEAMRFEGVVNMPINDTVAVRLGGTLDDRDGGFVKIKDPGSPLNGRALDKQKMQGIRGAVRWQTTPEIQQTLTLEYYELDNPSYAVYFSRPGRGDPDINSRACTVQLPVSRFIPGQFCQFNDKDQQSHVDTFQAFYEGKWDFGMGTLQLSGIYTDRDADTDDEWDTYVHALVGPTVGLSTTGQVLTGAAIGARGVGPTNDSLYPRGGHFQKSGGELLYTSNLEGPISFLVGADYYSTYDKSGQDNFISYRAPVAAGPIPVGALLATHRLNQRNSRDGESYSVFGSVEYRFDNFEISLEGRQTHNKTRNAALNATTILCPTTAPLPVNCPAPGAIIVNTVAVLPNPSTPNVVVTENIFTPVASLRYKFLENHAVYVRYGKGFRPGGFDTRNSGNVFFGEYQAEKVESYETGYKGTLFDRRLLLQLAYYYNVHHDFQIQDSFVGDDGFVRSKVGNAPKAESWGIEASGRMRIVQGDTRWTAGLSYAWNDGTIRPYTVPTATGTRIPSTFSNRRLSDTRDYQIVLDGGVETPAPFWEGAMLTANVSFQAEGGGFQNPQNTLRLPDTQLLDGSVGLETKDWRFNVFARNLTNERFLFQQVAGVFPEGLITIYNSPRTVGFEISRTW